MSLHSRNVFDTWAVYHIDRIDRLDFGEGRVICLNYFQAPSFLRPFPGVLEEQKLLMLSSGGDAIATYIHLDKWIGRAEKFQLSCIMTSSVRLVCLRQWAHCGICDIRIWVRSEVTRSGRCEENSSFAELWNEYLSRRFYWNWSAVYFFGIAFFLDRMLLQSLSE